MRGLPGRPGRSRPVPDSPSGPRGWTPFAAVVGAPAPGQRRRRPAQLRRRGGGRRVRGGPRSHLSPTSPGRERGSRPGCVRRRCHAWRRRRCRCGRSAPRDAGAAPGRRRRSAPRDAGATKGGVADPHLAVPAPTAPSDALSSSVTADARAASRGTRPRSTSRTVQLSAIGKAGTTGRLTRTDRPSHSSRARLAPTAARIRGSTHDGTGTGGWVIGQQYVCRLPSQPRKPLRALGFRSRTCPSISARRPPRGGGCVTASSTSCVVHRQWPRGPATISETSPGLTGCAGQTGTSHSRAYRITLTAHRLVNRCSASDASAAGPTRLGRRHAPLVATSARGPAT